MYGVPCFCCAEPDVASSDATNMECEIRREGNEVVINGRKWWSSGKKNKGTINDNSSMAIGSVGVAIHNLIPLSSN